MQSEWREFKLKDIARFQQGKQIELEDQLLVQTDNFIRFVRIIDYTNESEPPRYIKASTEWSSHVTKDDVVMIRYGSQTAGKVVIGKAGVIANNMFRVIPTIDDVHRKYLYYFLKSPKIHSYLRGGQSSSTMPAITFGLMSSIDVLLPSLSTQKKIAHILSTLDDKIELNRKMNQTLEAMAQALFKSWFVDFDPVHAKATAKSEAELERTAKELGLSKEILELFPSEFVESEMGMIPKGWKVVRLEDVTSKIGDGLHGTPKYDENGEYFFINGNNLTNGKIEITDNTKRASYDEYVKHKKELNDKTIFISINGTLGNIALYNGEKVFLGKSACYLNVIDSVNKQFVRYMLTSKYFQHYISVYATGTTIKNMGLKSMRNFIFRLPCIEIITAFDKIVSPMVEKTIKNADEIETLTKTRDTLLPKLLSGKLDVSEVAI